VGDARPSNRRYRRQARADAPGTIHAVTQSLSVIILAAGQGKRMRSDLPKVLQPLAGRPLLAHVIAQARALDAAAVHVVVGHGGDAVRAAFAGAPGLAWATQAEQKGTGHAVQQAIAAVPDDHLVLVLYGDVPLVTPGTLERLLAPARRGALGVLTAEFADPTGYGRIVRDAEGAVARIVEHKDANELERQGREVNTGLMAAPAADLKRWLKALRNDNAQGEYYLTDVVQVLSQAGHRVESLIGADPTEMLGINDRAQLAAAEAELRRRTNAAWLDRGVTMLDPANTYVDATVVLGADVTLFPGTILQGQTRIGEHSEIGPDARLVDTVVGRDCVVRSTFAADAEIGDGAVVGPFCHLPPGSSIAPGTTTGAFYTPS